MDSESSHRIYRRGLYQITDFSVRVSNDRWRPRAISDLRTCLSGFRRPTLALPTLSLSMISISSIKERMSRRLTLERSVLSYCQSIWDCRLFKFNNLPEWMKDNEYITEMHRPKVRKFSPISSIYTPIYTKWVLSLWNFWLENFHLNFIFNLNLMSLAKWLCESLFQSLFSMNLECLPDDSPRDLLHIICPSDHLRKLTLPE